MISLAQAVAPYRSERFATRAHVAIRWASCPFGPVLAALPPEGDVLDYGCGHGVLSFALAASRGRSVLGVDIDHAKIDVAARVAKARAAMHPPEFATIDVGDVPEGRWDGIAVVDVLYLVEPAAQRLILHELAERLRPGGTLVVKEMDTRPAAKAAWMRLQERVSVGALSITKGSSLSFTDAAFLGEAMTMAGLDVTVRRIDRRYPHPHVLLVGKRR